MGTMVFCAGLLPERSSQFSLLRPESFRLFLRVAIFDGKSFFSGEDWIVFLLQNESFTAAQK